MTILDDQSIAAERQRIQDFLVQHIPAPLYALALVSGGLDSDVVARLAASALSPGRIKLLTVIQDDMNLRHLRNARTLARDLHVPLYEVDLRGLNTAVIYRLAAGDMTEGFDPRGLLDPARMKCSLRTCVISTYQDRGYVILGASNRTEIDLGFFLPFGDGIWHVGPIAHLYKTEVRALARLVGTRPSVLTQPPSAGFWHGETDREDLGFWLVNGGPILRQRAFTREEVRQASEFSKRIDETAIDETLASIAAGDDPRSSPSEQKLGHDLAKRISTLVAASRPLKRREMGSVLQRRREA